MGVGYSNGGNYEFNNEDILYHNNEVEKSERIEQMKKVQKEGLELFSRKNKDYGDAFANYGTVGVLVRMGDKIQRLQSITASGITLNKDEKLRDTLIDLHNYAAMAIMLMDEAEEGSIKKI